MWGPPVRRCFINPMNTIGTINHSYWSYKPTERYRLGAPLCTIRLQFSPNLARSTGRCLPLRQMSWSTYSAAQKVTLEARRGTPHVLRPGELTSYCCPFQNHRKMVVEATNTMEFHGIYMELHGYRADLF